jgi:putative glycosyltransferase (TIGR04372 family)
MRDVFDCRYDVTQDFYEIAKLFKGINMDEMLVRRLLNDLKISQKYVVININVKDYHNESQNTRRIVHFERYNVLIDYLINKGYSVVLQGKNEQPYFKPRKGFFDYAHSNFQSAENDLALFYGCQFYVASKTGADWYAQICDKPILGLNYTELCGMWPNTAFRFFPKHIKDETGKYLSWQKFLTHPIYFQLGRNCPTQEKFEFVEMEEHEIITALEEFLQLLPKPREDWLNYSFEQK